MDDMYAVEVAGAVSVYRCQHIGGGRFRVFGDHHVYTPIEVDRATIDTMIRGRVVAEIRVKDERLILDAFQKMGGSNRRAAA